MAEVAPVIRQQAFSLGISAPFARLYTHLSGTSTFQPVFLDAARTVPSTQPLVADATGRFPIYFLADVAYRMELRDSAGAVVWGPHDDISTVSATVTPGGSTGQVQYNDGGDFGGDPGFTYDEGTDRLSVGSITLSGAANYINDTANANVTVGLTINQGVNDDQILAFKSSDVAHGLTALSETDTYGAFGKVSATGGGLLIGGICDADGTEALRLRATSVGAVTTVKSTAAIGIINIMAQEDSGADANDVTANGNMVTFRNNATTRFILDADGDSHQDVGTAWTNFDIADDVAVLNLLAAYVTRPDDPLRASFGQWLLRSRDTLERLRLVTFNDNGHHFVNMSRLTMLLVGAVRQVGSRVERLEQRLLALERPT